MRKMTFEVDEDCFDKMLEEVLKEFYDNSLHCDDTKEGEKDRKAFRRVYEYVTPPQEWEKW